MAPVSSVRAARLHVCIGGRTAHHPRDLGAWDVRQFRLVLIEPPGLQRVRKCDPGRVHVDDDAVGPGRFVDVDELRDLRTFQCWDVYGAHSDHLTLPGDRGTCRGPRVRDVAP
jgi:hypothetical protein